MTIVWDAGTAITGDGEVEGNAARVRVSVTSAYLNASKSSNIPARYFNLGTIGQAAGDYRDVGTRIIYEDQQVESSLPNATGWYWVLPSGVSGTLYRGVETVSDLAVAVQVYRNSSQTIATNSETAISFDTTVSDPFAMHDPSGNPTRLVAPTPGWYALAATVRWASNSTGRRDARVRISGSSYPMSVSAPASATSGTPVLIVSGVFWMNENDYAEVLAYQNSGGDLDATYNPGESLGARMVKVA